MELGLLGAFIGGVLTILSPCSVMLLPAFFSYAFASPFSLVARTGVFYLGLITTLVPLGMLAGTLGAFVNEHRSTFVTSAAWIVIILGGIMILGIPIPTLSRRAGTSTVSTAGTSSASTSSASTSGTSTAAVYALGTVYGLAGVCAGPLLGAVLTYAALGSNAVWGGIILLVFAAGMVLPLLILAFTWQKLPWVKRLVRPRELNIGRWHNTWTSVIGGAITAAVGILLLATEGTASIGGILGASEHIQLESWVMRTTGNVSNVIVIACAAGILFAIWITHRVRYRKRTLVPYRKRTLLREKPTSSQNE